MSSRADALKIAQADMVTISNHLSNARSQSTMFNRPKDEAATAIMLLERTARRMRKAFGFTALGVVSDVS